MTPYNSLPVIRTAYADDDLIAIWLHIAQDNEAAADRLLDRIDARLQQLATYPFSGAPREDIAPGIRHMVIGEYVTLYRVGESAIEILRVLHGEADDLKS
jgi:toxin ParE1/3/4